AQLVGIDAVEFQRPLRELRARGFAGDAVGFKKTESPDRLLDRAHALLAAERDAVADADEPRGERGVALDQVRDRGERVGLVEQQSVEFGKYPWGRRQLAGDLEQHLTGGGHRRNMVATTR